MQGWQTTFLRMRELPCASRALSNFEMKAFFTFDSAEREAIHARRGDAYKLGLAPPMGILRMSKTACCMPFGWFRLAKWCRRLATRNNDQTLRLAVEPCP